MARKGCIWMVVVCVIVLFAPGPGSSLVLGQVCAEEKLIPSDTEAGDNAGYHMAVSVDLNGDGLVALIGLSKDDVDGGDDEGSGWIYHFDGSEWIEEAKLINPINGINDFFCGWGGISAEVAVCGAANASGPLADERAHVYRYDPDSSEWLEEAQLRSSDPGVNDDFAYHLALNGDGDVVVCGARKHSDLGLDENGAAYVFRFDGTDWNETKLLASDAATHDHFGHGLAIGGDVIAVGSHDHNHFGDFDESGAAYIYRFDGTNWIEEAELRPSDPQEHAEFGHGAAVSLDGSVVVIGAPFPHVQDGATGAAYVYRFNGEEWVEEAKLEPSDGSGNDVFCENPAIDGDVIICGAHEHSHDGVDSGSAYVFRFDGTEWIEDVELLASDRESADFFGYASALIGDTALVGAFKDDNEYGNFAGAIYVYSLCPDDQGPCEGDANEDGIVDPLDAGFVLARFGCPVGTGDPSCDTADQNGDGIVDPLDSGFVLARFGECS